MWCFVAIYFHTNFIIILLYFNNSFYWQNPRIFIIFLYRPYNYFIYFSFNL